MENEKMANKSKEAVLNALDILNKINMPYEKFESECSKCKNLSLGNIQYDCCIKGYCPAFLVDKDINTLTRTFL